jgi:hypothetical protein
MEKLTKAIIKSKIKSAMKEVRKNKIEVIIMARELVPVCYDIMLEVMEYQTSLLDAIPGKRIQTIVNTIQNMDGKNKLKMIAGISRIMTEVLEWAAENDMQQIADWFMLKQEDWQKRVSAITDN